MRALFLLTLFAFSRGVCAAGSDEKKAEVKQPQEKKAPTLGEELIGLSGVQGGLVVVLNSEEITAEARIRAFVMLLT